MALSIVQQLVLSPGGDDDMGTLLGKDLCFFLYLNKIKDLLLFNTSYNDF